MCGCDCDSLATVVGTHPLSFSPNCLAIAHCTLRPTRASADHTRETGRIRRQCPGWGSVPLPHHRFVHRLDYAPPPPSYKPQVPIIPFPRSLTAHPYTSPILQRLFQSPPESQLALFHFHKCLISRHTPPPNSTNLTSLPPVCKVEQRVCLWSTNFSTFYLPGNLY